MSSYSIRPLEHESPPPAPYPWGLGRFSLFVPLCLGALALWGLVAYPLTKVLHISVHHSLDAATVGYLMFLTALSVLSAVRLLRPHSGMGLLPTLGFAWPSKGWLKDTALALTLGLLFTLIYSSLAMRLVGHVPASLPFPNARAHILITLFVACACAPVMEEVFFRGALLGTLYKYLPGLYLAPFLSATLFAAAHGNWLYLPSVLIPGFLMARLAIKYKSLVPSLTMHMLYNALALTAWYVTI